jgi:GTP-binding protein
MNLPFVTIVGRAGVGKTMLFSRLAGLKPYEILNYGERGSFQVQLPFGNPLFELRAAAYEEIASKSSVLEHSPVAINAATLVIFVVDATRAPDAVEHALAQEIRATGKPIILVANKADTEELAARAADFSSLGCGHPTFVSAATDLGLQGLFESILNRLQQGTGEDGIVLEIDVPEDLDDEDIVAHVTGLVEGANQLHRALGGHGLKITKLDVQAEIPVGVPQ